MTTVTSDPTSAPNLSEPADQQQSPLCRLPRELRDQIYEYYSYDEEGLEYDYTSKTLQYASGKELNLPRTCKMVANEMKGIHLQVNVVTFVPCCSEIDEDSICRRRSLAGRFEHLLWVARWTKMIMLGYAAECVTEEVIAKVTETYPAVRSVFRAFLHTTRLASELTSIGMSCRLPRESFTASFCDAVQYALDLSSTHPKFQELISKACELPDYYYWREPPFIQGSHQQVLGWRPDLWLIPTHDDLSPMEELLTVAPCRKVDCEKSHLGINFYFSATAICIAALSRLAPSTRKQLRSIILQEDCKSVGNPEVHAEGLIKYCTENGKLQFEMQASFSTMLAPAFWYLPGRLTTNPDPDTRTHVYAYIRILVDWMIRTTALTKLGMPKKSFTVVLDARSEQGTYIWQYVSRAAATRIHVPEEIENDDYLQSRGTTDLYKYLWTLPTELSSMVEDIIKDESIIRLEIPAIERSKRWIYANPYATWSLMDWFRVYDAVRDEVSFPGDAQAYSRKFWKELPRSCRNHGS